MNQFFKNRLLQSGIFALLGLMLFFVAYILNPLNHYVSALIMIVAAVTLYLLIVFIQAERNWLDIRAAFAGFWLGTIGLALLRLAKYQEPWLPKTWLIMALTYAVFQIGATVGMILCEKYLPKVKERCSNFKIGRIKFHLSQNRLFWICIITSVIGLTCFSINVAIKGFIPCFSNIFNAYVEFYTKFHIFTVASTCVSGLCYYCIRTQPLSRFKKVLLFICIFYHVIAMPILVVSRGVFVVSALSLTVSVFYLHRKKFLVLILCLAVIAGVYMFSSGLRNYTDELINLYFEPSEIPLPGEHEDASEPTGDDTVDSELDADTFMLPPSMAFLYGYITVSHDNLNEAVQNTQSYTWGLRQLAPFNVILRSDWIDSKLQNAEYYQVNPFLNTTNIVGDFYYDFGVIGVVVMMFLWSVVFGIMQAWHTTNEGIFSLMTLGYTMSPVALCFFSTWLSLFNHWMMWGTVLLFFIAASIHMEPKKPKAITMN